MDIRVIVINTTDLLDQPTMHGNRYSAGGIIETSWWSNDVSCAGKSDQ